MLTSTDPASAQTQYAYDGRGNPTSATDPLNNVTGYAYDSAGRLTQTTDPLGRTLTHAYDGYGNRTQTTDPLGNATAYQYTASRVTQRTDPLGRVTAYAYDSWGRQTGMSYPTTGNPGVSLTLDTEGRLTQSVDGTGTRTYAYDPWGRKVGMTDPMGNTAAAYDGAGRMQTQTDISGRTHSYAYDTSSRLQSVNAGSGAVSYTYTADSRPATAVYPNGTQATYGYDTSGRVTSLAHTLTSTGATIISYAAKYDSAGRLTQVTEQPSGAVTSYSYDSASRLLSESRTGTNPYSGSYTYDGSGNRKTALTVTNSVTTQNATYAYDGGGRLTQVNDAVSGVGTYAWNADGTLASLPRPGYTALLGYDEEGRLTGIQHNTNGTITPAYQYAYGADGGRRWRKDIANNVWTWYPCGVACCAGQLVETQSDLTGNNWSTSAQYLQGLNTVQRNAEFHHPDINGINAVVTGSNGVVLSSNIYDNFGVTQAAQGQAETPLRYGRAEEEGIVNAGGVDNISSLDLTILLSSASHPSDLSEVIKPSIDACSAGSNSASCRVKRHRPVRHKLPVDNPCRHVHDLSSCISCCSWAIANGLWPAGQSAKKNMSDCTQLCDDAWGIRPMPVRPIRHPVRTTV